MHQKEMDESFLGQLAGLFGYQCVLALVRSIRYTPNFLSVLLEHLKNTVFFDVENNVFDVENVVFGVDHDADVQWPGHRCLLAKTQMSTGQGTDACWLRHKCPLARAQMSTGQDTDVHWPGHRCLLAGT